MIYDKTFCNHYDCKNTKCDRHMCHIPAGYFVSISEIHCDRLKERKNNDQAVSVLDSVPGSAEKQHV